MATLETRTIDHVVIGDASSEKAHRFQGERTGTGPAPWPYSRWRDGTGWFSYELKLPQGSAAVIRCVFWGGDVGRRFDLLAEGQVLGSVTLDAPRPGDYVVMTFPVPPALAAAKDRITVRLQAREGSIAGGLFDLRTVRAEQGSQEKGQR